MPETDVGPIIDGISKGTLEPLRPATPPVVEESNPEPRKRYGSFYEAWPNVPELRKFTQRQGVPRLGLNAEGQAKAQELIDEYRNG